MSGTYTGSSGTYGHEPEVWSTKTKPNSSPFHLESTLMQLRQSCSYRNMQKCCILQFPNAWHNTICPFNKPLPFRGETPPLNPPIPPLAPTCATLSSLLQQIACIGIPPRSHLSSNPISFHANLLLSLSPPPTASPSQPRTPCCVASNHLPLPPHTWGDGLHSRTDCLLHLLCH